VTSPQAPELATAELRREEATMLIPCSFEQHARIRDDVRRLAARAADQQL
jgi:hypothetical protein